MVGVGGGGAGSGRLAICFLSGNVGRENGRKTWLRLPVQGKTCFSPGLVYSLVPVSPESCTVTGSQA